jgi:hypothetical protein
MSCSVVELAVDQAAAAVWLLAGLKHQSLSASVMDKRMGFTELEQKQCERVMGAFIEKRRSPVHLRPQLDIGIRVRDQCVEIFAVRPTWDQPEETIETLIAKATSVKAQNVWRVFWMRQDLKWHRYDPASEVPSLEQFAQLVHKDKHACFFG